MHQAGLTTLLTDNRRARLIQNFARTLPRAKACALFQLGRSDFTFFAAPLTFDAYSLMFLTTLCRAILTAASHALTDLKRFTTSGTYNLMRSAFGYSHALARAATTPLSNHTRRQHHSLLTHFANERETWIRRASQCFEPPFIYNYNYNAIR